MSRPPRRRDEPILDAAGMRWILALGGYIGLASLGLFLFRLAGDPEANLLRAQTVAFTAMVVLEQVNLLNHRSLRSPLREVGVFSNPWLLAALAGTVLMHLAAIYLPALQRVLHTTGLGWTDWALTLAVALPLFVVPETLKWRRARRNRPWSPPEAPAAPARPT
jgi:Ca2+-transporting ATPase